MGAGRLEFLDRAAIGGVVMLDFDSPPPPLSIFLFVCAWAALICLYAARRFRIRLKREERARTDALEWANREIRRVK